MFRSWEFLFKLQKNNYNKLLKKFYYFFNNLKILRMMRIKTLKLEDIYYQSKIWF